MTTAIDPAGFTAGPWRALGRRLIVTTGGGGLPICEIWPAGVGDDQAEANQRLIAAAPELHQALTAIVGDDEASLPPRTARMIAAALARVKGRAQS